MKARILLVCVLVAAPVFVPAASKEIQELQRDIALLQQQMKDMQRSQDEKFASIIELARQSIEAANRANTGVAVIQSNLDKNLRALQDSVASPVVGLGTRLTEISNNVNTLTQAVSDLNQSLNRMQSQLTDIKQQLAVMQKPPEPPKQEVTPGGPGTTGAPGGAAPAPCPTGSATAAYDAALNDYRSGKLDLSVSEFNDYLRCFGNTNYAPNAQFYIAMSHYTQTKYDDAVREFDLVLEKYQDNPKTPEALLYKGRALAQTGHRTDGANEWLELIKRFPRSEAAKMACADRQAFGLSCSVPGSGAPAKKGSGQRKK